MPSSPFRSLVLLLIGALALAGCTSGTEETSESPEVESAASETEEEEEFDETVEPEWEGAPLNPFDLREGQCFNEVSWIDEIQDRRINITAVIDCSEPHDREVYHAAEFPAPAGAPFPGEAAMRAWSTELCYSAFEGFVGEEYELSLYGIDFLQPTKDTFEHPVGRHRQVTCFLYDTAGEPLVETARSSSI